MGSVNLIQLVLVMLGAAVGGGARHLVTAFISASHHNPAAWPWGTLLVNVSGCLAIGAILPWIADQSNPRENLRLLVAVGLLGGYTTLSAFSLETLRLLEAHRPAAALLYIFATNTAGLGAAFAGALVGRLLTKF